MAQYPELGSLQAKVLCYITEENPSSIKQTADAVVSYTGGYRNVYDIFKKFENDGYILNHGENGYYTTYIGVNLALLNGADPNKLRENVKLFFQDEQLDLLLLACDMGGHPNLGLEMLRFFNATSDGLAKGELRIIGLPLENGKLKDFLSLLKKYPRLYKRVHWVLRKALEMTF